MKKIIAIILASFVCMASVFAGWFDERYFELAVDVPVGVSNNSIKITDILQEHLVIDFREIADNMPDEGFGLYAYTNPNLSFTLRLKNIKIGGKTGVETWANGVISKDLFEYIGYGNELGETISISQKVNADVFAVQEFFASFNIKQFKVTVRPAFFVPFVHIGSNDGTLTLKNDADGNVIVNYDSTLAIYSAYDFKNGGTSFSPGFDLAGSVTYPLFDFLSLTGNIRFPIVPGQLGYKIDAVTTMNFETSVDKIVKGSMGDKNFDNEIKNTASTSYKINRPMKINVFADCTPLGDWVVFTGGLGIGFLHPFTEDKDSFEAFAEYYLGSRVMLGNILSAGISTQYYEKLFIHQIEFSANVRVFELDFGLSSQATGFLKSCSAGGIGTYITVKLGF